MKKYLTNRDLVAEVIISKNIGRRTEKLEDMLIILSKNVIKKMSYNNPEDRYDCLNSGILRLLNYWRYFDEEKYENAFALYTEIFKRAIAEEYNRINYKNRYTGEYMKMCSLSFDDGGDWNI